MADLTFYPQSIDDATLVVTSEATGYSKYNLQDRRKDTSWRSTSNANQNIDMDFGVAYTADHGFFYHNLPAGSYVDIYYATQANYSDELSVTSNEPTPITGTGPRYLAFEFPFSGSYTKRYWRIKITNMPGSTVAEIFLFFLGARKVISVRYNYGQIIGSKFSTKLFESLAGNRSAVAFQGARRIWKLAFEYMSKTNRDNLISVLASASGKRYPIFMLDPDMLAYYYVRLMHDEISDPEVTHQLYNINQLLIEEEF